MYKKLALLVFAYYALNLISCADKCPSIHALMDFESFQVYPDMLDVVKGDTLRLNIAISEVLYVEEPSTNFEFNWFPQLYAEDCEYAGQQGWRNEIEQIEITSDADFDAQHPAGTLLNDLFFVYFDDYGIDTYLPLTQCDHNYFFYLSLEAEKSYFGILTTPTLSQTHHFTFKAVKENEKEYSDVSPGVVWM